MRIIVTSHMFLPEHSTGTEIIAYNIARHLQTGGHIVRVVTGFPQAHALSEAERFDSYTYNGLQVHRYLNHRPSNPAHDNVVEAEYDDRLFHRWFDGLVGDFRPDVVHFVHLARLSASAINVCERHGVPMVMTATDFWLICPIQNLRLPDGSLCSGPVMCGANCVQHFAALGQPSLAAFALGHAPTTLVAVGAWAIRRGLMNFRSEAKHIDAITRRPAFLRDQARKLQRILVPSNIMKQMLSRNGIPTDRMMHLPYGIDVSQIPRDTNKGAAPTLRVGFLGCICEHKGTHVLLEAVRRMPRDVPIELRLHGMMGDKSDYNDRVQAIIDDDDRIEYVGPYDNEQVGQVLAGLDVLVCPSIWYENTPLVIYEAMAAGVPVVATRLGGMAESVEEGVNGALFEKGDAAELSGILARLAENRDEVRRLAEKTRPPMTVAEHVTRLEAIYESLLSDRTVDAAPAEAALP